MGILSRITGIFGIPEMRNHGKILKIPKKCVRSKCFSQFCGSTIKIYGKYVRVKTIIVLFTTQSASLQFFYNYVVRTLGNLPTKFPLHFIYWTILAYLQDHSVFRMTGMDGRVGLI